MRVAALYDIRSNYEGRAGAFWALLGPDVELRRTVQRAKPESDHCSAVISRTAASMPAPASSTGST